jgi:hypothetical protein
VTLLFASSGAPHGDSNITSLPIVGYIVTNWYGMKGKF